MNAIGRTGVNAEGVVAELNRCLGGFDRRMLGNDTGNLSCSVFVE